MPKDVREADAGPKHVLFETENASIRFTDAGGGMVVIQSPHYAREAMVLTRGDVTQLHNLLAKVIGRT